MKPDRKPGAKTPLEANSEFIPFYPIYCPDCGDLIGTTSEAEAKPVRCGPCQHLHSRLQPLSEKLDRIITLLERLAPQFLERLG